MIRDVQEEREMLVLGDEGDVGHAEEGAASADIDQQGCIRGRCGLRQVVSQLSSSP
jgi:hypothetical protein